MKNSVATPTDSLRASDWGQLRMELIWMYQGSPGAMSGSFDTSPLAAWRLLEGQVTIRAKGRQFQAKAGEWIFLPRVSERYFSRTARILSIRFRAEWLDGKQLFELPEPVICSAKDHPDLDDAARAIHCWIGNHLKGAHTPLAECQVDLSQYLEISRVVVNWIDEFAKALARAGIVAYRVGPVDARVLQVYRQLSAYPLNVPPAFDEITLCARLSRKQIERLFRAYAGVSMRSYFDRRRLEAAQRLLIHSQQPVKEIGFNLGFTQLSHFSIWFKRQSGHSPTEFRESHALAGW